MMDKMGDVEYLVRQAISSAAAAGNQKRATRAESWFAGLKQSPA